MGAEALCDEYAPPLRGSPQIWPAKARYVTGFKLKKLDPLPDIPRKLKQWVEKDAEAVARLNQSINEERIGMKRSASTTFAQSTLRGRTDKYGRLTKSVSKSVSDARKMKYWRGVTVMTGGHEGAQDVRQQLEKETP